MAFTAFQLRRPAFNYLSLHLCAKGNLSGVEQKMPKESDIHIMLKKGFVNLKDVDLIEFTFNDVLGPYLTPGEIDSRAEIK